MYRIYKVLLHKLGSRINVFRCTFSIGTSDGGNGNHSVSLPIILIKIKVDQMLTSLYIYKLAVGIYFMILRLISYFHECTALFWG